MIHALTTSNFKDLEIIVYDTDIVVNLAKKYLIPLKINVITTHLVSREMHPLFHSK